MSAPLVMSRYPTAEAHVLASMPPSGLRSSMVDLVRAWVCVCDELVDSPAPDAEQDFGAAMFALVLAVAPAGGMTEEEAAALMAEGMNP